MLTSRKTILFLITEDWYFCSHRLAIAREALRQGMNVIVATRIQKHRKQIEQEGMRVIPIRMVRSGKNPFKELLAVWELIRIYRNERPDIVHHVAMKPVLYGSLAARVVRVPHVVNAFAGMGYLFISNRLKTAVLRKCISLAFRVLLNRSNSRIILQNPDDQRLLVQSGILNPERIEMIRGSGADTELFFPTPEPAGSPTVVLASRMLWDKGVGEFVEAALLLRKEGVNARFVLVGDTDPENPKAVPSSQLEFWNKSGIVEWWGKREDMPKVFAEAHIVCLPSYREGLPKVLIEAAACGRAIVATDVPGCREIVLHEKNGLLVQSRSASDLATALERLIRNQGLRQSMGIRGRELAVTEFSVDKIVGQTMSLYRKLTS